MTGIFPYFNIDDGLDEFILMFDGLEHKDRNHGIYAKQWLAISIYHLLADLV